MAKKQKPQIIRIEDILNNPVSKAKLQGFLDEAIKCKRAIADQNESIKAMKDEAKEQIGCDPKIFSSLVSIFHKNKIAEKKFELESLDNAIDLLLMNTGNK